MVQRIQKAKSRGEFEREERLASQTLGGDGTKKDVGTNVGGAGTMKNTARGAESVEAEDYDEDDMRMLGGTPETGDTASIKAGTYEEDYGTGVQGRRTEGQTGASARKPALPRKERTVAGGREDQDDFPTGKWSRQKVRAKLSSAPGTARATKESSHRRGETRTVKAAGDRGRRGGETGSFRGRNAGGRRPRQTGLGAKPAAKKGRETTNGRTATERGRAAGGQASGGLRKNAATPAAARRKTVQNKGRLVGKIEENARRS